MDNSEVLNRQRKLRPIGPTNEHNPCTKSRQFSALPHPKLPQAHARIPVEKPQKKKRQRINKKKKTLSFFG